MDFFLIWRPCNRCICIKWRNTFWDFPYRFSFPCRCSLSEVGANLNYSFFAKYISSLNTENHISILQYLYHCVDRAINSLFIHDSPQITWFYSYNVVSVLWKSQYLIIRKRFALLTYGTRETFNLSINS